MARFILRRPVAKTPTAVIPPRPQAPLQEAAPVVPATPLESEFPVLGSVKPDAVAKLASVLPNLQQIPRTGEAATLAKKLFSPMDGLPTNPVKATKTQTALVLPSLPVAPVPTPAPIKFEHADKLYRYVYRRSTPAKAGQLKLNITAAKLAEFRTSPEGRRVEQFVDILGQSSSWYEVTSQDFENWNELTSTDHDGLKPWLLAFNAFFNRQTNANDLPAAEPVKKVYPKVVLTPSGRITVAHPPINPDRLAKLAARFRRR